MISNKEKNFISAVVYVQNCENEIKQFLEKLNEVLNKNFNKYEIICVNDASTDNSVNKINEFANNVSDSIVTILNMSYYQGLELSMNAGVDLSIGDFVYEFDNIYMDYKMDIVVDVYKKSLEGFDIVSASPDKNKSISSKLFYKVFNKNANNMYELETETFRILSRRAINRVQSINKTIPYRKAVYANCGLKLSNIKYETIRKTSIIKDKRLKNQRKDLAVDSLILFTNVAYKISIFISILMMIVAIATGIYTLYIFICQNPISGWTTTMLLLSFSFFGIFTILTIIIKYLSIVIDLIFKKQKYIVESIEKITK